MKLIVGLGNPGVEYEKTRHNFGFMALDNFAVKQGVVWQNKAKFSALTAELTIKGEKVILVKPQTFYNLVGESVQKLRAFYKLDLTDILVIHDEMALSLGTIRVRRGGSDAGNNGIKNIINNIGSEFVRVRIGSGLNPTVDGDAQPAANRRDYVLSGLNSADNEIFQSELSIVDQIIVQFVAGDLTDTTYRS
ncbi:MAG: aminoacyl-tRNA hydrolase [Candidatus Saccharibacteria bacterium]|nr:aminoacyl-tRNA hydrolase [Candidatus Saccharibacteria bacterium]